MTLVDHAQRELKLCGQYDEDPAYAQSIIAAVAAFASYGHSGGSAACGIHQLTDLLQYKALSPLTSDPEEWMNVADHTPDEPGVWQSRRDPSAFSNDGGKTYYLLDETPRQTHTSAKPRHTA